MPSTKLRSSSRRTLRATIVSVVAGNLAKVLGLAGGFMLAQVLVPASLTAVPHEPAPAHPAAAIIAEHGCWTGEAPADMDGVFPGHVVVSAPGRGAHYAGERMVGLALEQIFEGADHDLTVHAFCR